MDLLYTHGTDRVEKKTQNDLFAKCGKLSELVVYLANETIDIQ